ncbi:MAG: SDR family oxidoreductase [Oscillospiraceae bacterium]|nr:SDR family oxidoreductase [Oscillospiraceae bacterium]
MGRNIVCDAVDYTGRTVMITGAAQGAGAGIARRFAQAGANLAITYNHNADAAAEKVAEFTAMGVKAAAFHLDQRETDTIEGVVAEIVKTFGGIDVLVNNAGIYPHQTNLEMTPAEWDDMLDSNTRGVYFVCQAVGKVMKDQPNGGSIVNISSINATCPSDTLVHYGTSKAAVEFFTRGLAHDWGKYGIRVNCIAPGLIEAPMLDVWVPGWRESYCERAPLGRLVSPEDLGNAAIFLGSPLASFITGQILTVDGGVLMAPAFNWT